MASFQVWLVQALTGHSLVTGFMRTAWGWPAMESLHFIGLCLMVGTIVVFDLRLLGMARRIPIAALHRLIPYGLAGYALTLLTGLTFVRTEPDQYIYNPAFHFKVLFMAVAGVNALMFYVIAWRRVKRPDAPADAPRAAKMIAAVSLGLWMGVIVAGRLLTFYRPPDCEKGAAPIILECIPR